MSSPGQVITATVNFSPSLTSTSGTGTVDTTWDTLGHALERLEAYAGRSHGEAVAVGMVFAARLSETLGIADPGLAALHQRLLKGLGLDLPRLDRSL